MFELPYLEIYAETFDRRFKNSVLQKVDILQEKCINVSVIAINENLIGNELKKVWREGLSLWFQFKNYAVLEMNLSSCTELSVTVQSLEADSGLLNLYFTDGQILSVKDPQAWSSIHLNPVHESAPDVLSKEMSYKYLMDLFANLKEEIKYVLVNQSLIRGIGEAYADEILWYAEISPFSIASKIPPDSVKVLHKTIKYVLLDAIKQARKIKAMKFDKTDPDLLMIHNAQKKNSPTGKTIKVKMRHGIATYYTDEQIFYV